jgi:hypothetical protein
MRQSGKIVVCSTALSITAVLGVVSLLVLQDPAWRRSATDWALRALEVWPKQLAGLFPFGMPEGPATAPGPSPQSSETVAPPPPHWSDREIAAALMECVHLLAPLNAEVVPLGPIRYGDCGTLAPVLLRSLGAKEKIVFEPPLLTNCPMVAALSHWLEKKVQPAAHASFGQPVARIASSGYSCRTLYNRPNDRLSQHAFANAIDLPLFILSDGRKVDVTHGWGPTRRELVAEVKAKLVPIVAKASVVAKKAAPREKDAPQPKDEPTGSTRSAKAPAVEGVDPGDAASEADAASPDPASTPQATFLRKLHQDACEQFSTVLGPEANDVHRTHLHLDLQNRNALNVCK